MKVAVTGALGQLGGELCRQLGADAAPLDLPDFDVTSPNTVARVLRELQPGAVVNAAAYTQVDRAEQDEELCRRVNATAVGTLAQVCRELDCPLVQISTDYVFGGQAGGAVPYREEDEPSPQGMYARTKLEGERQTAQWEKHYIVRTCGLYVASPSGPVRGRNFVDTMLVLGRERDRVRIVADQVCTPTYVPHLARAILFLITTARFGLYHVVNSGAATWLDFAREIFRQANVEVALEPISTEEYGAAAARPRYSVLDTAKYHALGGPPMPPWQQGLADYFETLSGCSANLSSAEKKGRVLDSMIKPACLTSPRLRLG